MSFSKKTQTVSEVGEDIKTNKKQTFNIGSLFMGDRVIWIVYFFLCELCLSASFQKLDNFIYLDYQLYVCRIFK